MYGECTQLYNDNDYGWNFRYLCAQSAPDPFFRYSAPIINSVTDGIVIRGEYFGTSGTVSSNYQNCPIVVYNETYIECNGVVSFPVTLTVAGQTKYDYHFILIKLV